MAMAVLWNFVLMMPMMEGPKYPPRLPMELTIAIPPAAATPDKYRLGKDQNEDDAVTTPAQATVNAIKPNHPGMPGIAETAKPSPPAATGIAM